MRNFLRDLESAWWHWLKPEFQEPERDETTPQAFAEFVAKSKHPQECAGGCRCTRGGKGVT